MANTLFLRLEGAFQSWGERAQWSVRDTSPEPTKSGVIGLLGCALGLTEDIDLSDLSKTVRIGVRCDLPGTLMTDYHTVTGGVMSAEGKIKMTAATKENETVVSTRDYICDGSFLVAIQGKPETIAECSRAVRAPVWPYYLGRKACIPSLPVYAGEGTFASLEDALRSQPVSSRVSADQVRLVIECNPSEGVRRNDQLESRKRRTFTPRYSQEMLLETSLLKENSR